MTRNMTGAIAGGLALGAGIWMGLQWTQAGGQRRYTFRERCVLITGGSRGLGLVLARQLAREGARIGILARDRAEMDRAVEQLERLGADGDADANADPDSVGPHVVAVQCDLQDEQQIRHAVDQVADRLGGLDMVINNAGVIQVGPMEHMSDADYAQMVDIYAWGPLRVSLAALPHLDRRDEGRIVNICSIGGKVAMPHLLPYTIGKFAEVGLSDGLRAELKERDIHVTTVIPGLMRTGSPRNALFKGRHREEYTWFAISDALPGVSIGVERAARKIIEAARRRKTHLYITPQARAAAVCNELAPGFVAWLTSRIHRLLPGPTPDRQAEAHPGYESTTSWAPSMLTTLADRAAERNNEVSDGRSGATARPDSHLP